LDGPVGEGVTYAQTQRPIKKVEKRPNGKAKGQKEKLTGDIRGRRPLANVEGGGHRGGVALCKKTGLERKQKGKEESQAFF